jgi:nucleoid-associated protein YgaU
LGVSTDKIMATNKIIVQHRQTLWDLALQHCGSANSAFSISRLNNIALTDMPASGTELIVPGVENKTVVNYYADNGIVPATDNQRSMFWTG